MPCHRWRIANGAHQPRKTPRDFAIHLAPERHHKVGYAIEPLPSPRVEFRLLAVARRQRIDLIILSGKTQREPFLALAAEFCQPVRRRSLVGREIVSEP